MQSYGTIFYTEVRTREGGRGRILLTRAHFTLRDAVSWVEEVQAAGIHTNIFQGDWPTVQEIQSRGLPVVDETRPGLPQIHYAIGHYWRINGDRVSTGELDPFGFAGVIADGCLVTARVGGPDLRSEGVREVARPIYAHPLGRELVLVAPGCAPGSVLSREQLWAAYAWYPDDLDVTIMNARLV